MARKSTKQTAPSKTEEKPQAYDSAKSDLVNHAKRELKLALIDAHDSDLGGVVSQSVIELIDLFASRQHSENTSGLVRHIFNALTAFQTLSPITDDPAEWDSVAKQFNEPAWQNLRNPRLFSKDGGKTFMNMETQETGVSEPAKTTGEKKPVK